MCVPECQKRGAYYLGSQARVLTLVKLYRGLWPGDDVTGGCQCLGPIMIETEIDMASEALGSAYVLSEVGARQLAEMTTRGSAPVASPGFSSRLHESASADSRLTALERLVSAHAPGR